MFVATGAKLLDPLPPSGYSSLDVRSVLGQPIRPYRGLCAIADVSRGSAGPAPGFPGAEKARHRREHGRNPAPGDRPAQGPAQVLARERRPQVRPPPEGEREAS